MKTKIGLLGVVRLVLGLAGCGGQGGIKEKEGMTTGFRLLEMEGGYIDEAAATPDAQITRLTPWVELDRKTGMAGNMGFTLLRVVNDREVLTQHTVRWLTVTPGNEMGITAGGRRVTLHAMGDGKRWHKTKIDSGGYSSTTYFEEVRYEIDAADMSQVASAPITRIEAQGSKGGAAWPRFGKSMLPDYSTKVGAFYREQIAPRL